VSAKARIQARDKGTGQAPGTCARKADNARALFEGALMRRFQTYALLGLVVAVPAAAQAFLPQTHPCFTSGTTTYQISASAPTPDYKVKIDNRMARPDLRMQLVDQPELADLVLVDDVDATQGNACAAPSPLKTIRIDEGETLPDLTISLATAVDAPDLKLYVRSARFSPEDAAALFGVMWQASRIRDVAERR
jgi:hypothetical protein